MKDYFFILIIRYLMHVLNNIQFSIHLKTHRYKPGVITLITAYFDFSSVSEKVMHILSSSSNATKYKECLKG